MFTSFLVKKNPKKHDHPPPFGGSSCLRDHCTLRLALALCINGCIEHAFYVIAVVCSSWSAVNAGTSSRDLLTPYGNEAIPGVRSGNRMVATWGTCEKVSKFFKGLYLQVWALNYSYPLLWHRSLSGYR